MAPAPRYFGREWPSRPLYDRMLNSAMADERAVETIVRSIAVFDDTRAKGMTRLRAELG